MIDNDTPSIIGSERSIVLDWRRCDWRRWAMTEKRRIIIEYETEDVDQSIAFANELLVKAREAVRIVRVTLEASDSDE